MGIRDFRKVLSIVLQRWRHFGSAGEEILWVVEIEELRDMLRNTIYN